MPGVPSKLGYLPALDGLRAVAVLAVMAYHSGLIHGGFLGVDVFFTLSGFLITTLLCEEHARHYLTQSEEEPAVALTRIGHGCSVLLTDITYY